MLEGAGIRALVVGGGRVAARKAAGLLAAGASVRVIARDYSDDLLALGPNDLLCIEAPRSYAADALGDATFVIAATSDARVNREIAADAKASGRLVNVVDDPSLGTCTTPAVHRADALVIAVSAGGVPRAAGRVRAAIASRFDERYGAAVARLASVRQALLGDGGEEAGRARWLRAQQVLLGEDFCETVEAGTFESRVAEWA